LVHYFEIITFSEKFINRFQKIESHYNQDYDKMNSASLDELDEIWNRVKNKDDNKK